MPINYLQIQGQINEFAVDAKNRQNDIEQLGKRYKTLLRISADSQLELILKIETAIKENSSLWCAIPTQEKIDEVFPLPEKTFPVTIIAADGSQVVPNHHRQVEFGMINTSAISFRMGSKEAPKIFVESQLLNMDDIHQESGIRPDSYVALVRDVAERKILADKTEISLQPVVTLTDGVMDLFRENRDSKIYQQKLKEYLVALERLMSYGAITAAYVDKPGSNFVLRMLDIASSKDTKFRDSNGFSYLPDKFIFDEILKHRGDRSALYKKHSFSTNDYIGDLSIYFFYLNISKNNHPQIVRIEVPAWVANDNDKMNLLHTSLVEQAWILADPFPYVLHRAHEEAVVTFEESSRLEEMIIAQLLKNGVKVGQKSNKQTHKDHPGKRRYGS
jgi:hypothetical protein